MCVRVGVRVRACVCVIASVHIHNTTHLGCVGESVGDVDPPESTESKKTYPNLFSRNSVTTNNPHNPHNPLTLIL